MEDLFKRVTPLHFYPPFWVKLQQLAANCRAQGVDYWAISGNRTYAEQDILYAQGRSTPGNIVTNAKGGQSNHNFKIGCDFCRDADRTIAGLQPDWKTADYEILAVEAEKLGLESGLHWKSLVDPGHIQLPIGKYNIKLKDLDTAYKTGGYPAVFVMLNRYQW